MLFSLTVFRKIERKDLSLPCENVLPMGAANCSLRKRPPDGNSKLQLAKTSSRRQQQIAACENVLPTAAANCSLRKRPPDGSGKLQLAKASCTLQDEIAEKKQT
ncbi:hypothetical protein [Phocaeicola salanitronis]|uniref:hypothetical protein n=1 Tax=Phocaeicola salanitronis TaxID=376805 RepID=UPI0025A3E64A|nr:hypothetical protein [Phocaeicola salanitronis]MDM8307344.1 hypothetical protein [Phocaeicola salanitronis]